MDRTISHPIISISHSHLSLDPISEEKPRRTDGAGRTDGRTGRVEDPGPDRTGQVS